jgi:hypothetical protein
MQFSIERNMLFPILRKMCTGEEDICLFITYNGRSAGSYLKDEERWEAGVSIYALVMWIFVL